MDSHFLVQMPLMAKAGGLSEAVRPGSPTLCAAGGTLCMSSWPLCWGFSGTAGAQQLQGGEFATMLRPLFFYPRVCGLLPGILLHKKPRMF